MTVPSEPFAIRLIGANHMFPCTYLGLTDGPSDSERRLINRRDAEALVGAHEAVYLRDE
jgi:hypothetical protein